MAAVEGKGEGRTSSKTNLFLGSYVNISPNHEAGPVMEGWLLQGMDTFWWVSAKRMGVIKEGI